MVTTPRQEAILRHIGRYALTLRPVLDVLFYGGQANGCDADVAQLRAHKLIAAVENAVADTTDPHTRYSFYQLTKAGAKVSGASEYRAKSLGGQAVARYLSFLWFCCIKKPRRHRIGLAQLVEIFGEEILSPNGAKKRDLLLPGFHCLEKTEDSYRIRHLYAPKTSVGDTATELRKRLRDARTLPVIERAILDRQYGFAVLAETTQQRDALRAHLANAFAGDPVSIIVACSPGPWRRTGQ
jgi:hypothetical protein